VSSGFANMHSKCLCVRCFVFWLVYNLATTVFMHLIHFICVIYSDIRYIATSSSYIMASK